MTKAEIADKIHATTKYTKKESADLVDMVFSMLKDTLESGENLKISGFGNFEVKRKADRKGRNPQTGEEIVISARKILTFKPSVILKNSINGNIST